MRLRRCKPSSREGTSGERTNHLRDETVSVSRVKSETESSAVSRSNRSTEEFSLDPTDATGRQNQPPCTRRISPGNYPNCSAFRRYCRLAYNICEGRRAHNAATSTKDGITNYLTGALHSWERGPHAPQAAPSETQEASVNEAAAYRLGILSYVPLDAMNWMGGSPPPHTPPRATHFRELVMPQQQGPDTS